MGRGSAKFVKSVQSVTPQDRERALAVVPGGGGGGGGGGRLLEGHLARLAALPAHGNRTLRVDQLFLGLLLSFFDPLARSLRLVEDAGDFGGRLGLPRLARSTTADALAAFDPACLLPVIQDLRGRVPGLADGAHDDADLSTITRRIIAGDGTYLTILARVAWALHHTKTSGRRQGQVRANVQLDVANWVPRVVTVSGDDGLSEPAASPRTCSAACSTSLTATSSSSRSSHKCWPGATTSCSASATTPRPFVCRRTGR